jgi:serine protease AprX
MAWPPSSGRGPTKEGRIKPDIAGPGTSILSARSRRSSLDSSNVWGSVNGDWVFFGRTSMATPLVASYVAPLRKALIDKSEKQPSTALVKALLINGARELIGQYNPPQAGASPNPNSAWDQVNLANLAVFAVQKNPGYAEGDENEVVNIPIAGGNRELKATLVGADP